MENSSLNIAICGQAGEGIKVSGLMLGKSLIQLGYSVFGYNEYPSLIRGGINVYYLHVNANNSFSQVSKIDLLIGLSKEGINQLKPYLTAQSNIIYDPDEIDLSADKLIGNLLPIRLSSLAVSVGGKPIMANSVALGAVLTCLGLNLASFLKVLAKEFKDKDPKITFLNQKAANEGMMEIKNKFTKFVKTLIKPQNKKSEILITGNEAIALGALSSGLQFFCSYPMTPTTNILHYLSKTSKKTQILVKQGEDEISVINMALGASLAGCRSLVATAGSGLCLMTEGITMAGMAEIPIVVINGQRPGPAAGMPTWTSQGDLQFVTHLGHDDFTRIVLAPGDAKEAFTLTQKALILAEKYQLPVIILTDKYLSESDYSVEKFSSHFKIEQQSLTNNLSNDPYKPFKRYLITKDGLSPRSIPGQNGGIYCCNSYEHDETGKGIEKASMRKLMIQKRLAKVTLILKELVKPNLFGPKKAKLSLISWGSNKGPILEALKKLPEVNFLHLSWLLPFPKKEVLEFLKLNKNVICLEANATGQLKNLIREQIGINLKSLLKFDGRPFWPEEIIKKLT